ncbi:hypothetical protein J6590_048330 [Homalodisca vitripennis]|nr:hypothetical protein J6590_048330 [Homalodisca vitripennis]
MIVCSFLPESAGGVDNVQFLITPFQGSQLSGRDDLSRLQHLPGPRALGRSPLFSLAYAVGVTHINHYSIYNCSPWRASWRGGRPSMCAVLVTDPQS